MKLEGRVGRETAWSDTQQIIKILETLYSSLPGPSYGIEFASIMTRKQ